MYFNTDTNLFVDMFILPCYSLGAIIKSKCNKAYVIILCTNTRKSLKQQ